MNEFISKRFNKKLNSITCALVFYLCLIWYFWGPLIVFLVLSGVVLIVHMTDNQSEANYVDLNEKIAELKAELESLEQDIKKNT